MSSRAVKYPAKCRGGPAEFSLTLGLQPLTANSQQLTASRYQLKEMHDD
jgi:hypothetical protein